MLYNSKTRKYNITQSLIIREKNVVVNYISDPELASTTTLNNIQLSFSRIPTLIIPRIKERFTQHLKPVNPNDVYNKTIADIKDNKRSFLIKRLVTKAEPALVIDHTHMVQSILNANLTGTTRLNILFNYLNTKFTELNLKYPDLVNIYIFNLTSNSDNSLFKLLSSIRKKYQKLNIDNVAYITIPRTETTDCNFIPFIGFNSNNEVELLTSKFSQVGKYLKAYVLAANIEKDSKEISSELNVSKLLKKLNSFTIDKPSPTLLSNLNNADKVLNEKTLTSAFSKTKIKDKSYAESLTQRLKSNKKLNGDTTPTEVARVIHKSLYGTKKIKPEFIDDPDKLVKVASKISVSSKTVKYVKEKHTNVAVNAKDLVKIDTFTAPVKHKYEFNDQIHDKVRQLFTILENNPDSPIAIKSFKYEYKDDNFNRHILYTIKVKNKTGGRKGVYELKLKVPALVNEKYFKLHGKEYILSTQQFLNAITKDKPDQARFISQYNMITLKIEKLKFSISQIQELIEYINLKHANILHNVKYDSNNRITSCEVNSEGGEDGRSKIGRFKLDFISEIFYEVKYETITAKNGKYYLTNTAVEPNIVDQVINANLYVFEKLKTILAEIGDTVNQSKKILPFIQVHVMGRKLPFIIYLAHRLGLINALLKLNVDYEIIEDEKVEPKETPTISFKLEGDAKTDSMSVLHIYTDNTKKELVINGLAIAGTGLKLSASQLTDATAMDDYINEKYGKSTVFTFDLLDQNFIDPVTKELFEAEGKDGDDLYGIMTHDLLNKLIDDKEDNLTDLNHLRTRQSELITALLYRELAMATNRYKQSMSANMDDAHIFLQEDYIINNLLGKHVHNDGSSMLNYINNFGPIEEIVTSSRVIKTGIGGIPNVRSFRKEHRDLHPTHIGNISSHGTSEYTVGIVNQHTIGAMVDDKTGKYINSNKADLKSKDNWAALSIDEGLVPFIDQMDSDRLILARTHNLQKIPIKNAEVPLVSSGAEAIVGHISSTKFVKTAELGGVVTKLKPDESITVKYNNGKSETFNIIPRYSSTKRHSTVIRMKLNTLKVGDKFEKDQMIYWADTFNGDSYVIGKNVTLAILNYHGLSHEDGYVISNHMATDYVTDSIKRIVVLVPPNTKLNSMAKIGDETKINDKLIAFSYDGDLQKYISGLSADAITNGDEVSEVETVEEVDLQSGFSLTNNEIRKLSIGGQIVDIKIIISAKGDVGSGLITKWKEQNARLNKISKSLKADNNTGLVDNIDMSVVRTHGIKKFQGAIVEFYIKNEKSLGLGDKLSNRFGAKGVISHIIPEDESVIADVSGRVDIFLAPTSILGRKNTSILKEMYLGKILFHLSIWARKQIESNAMKIKDVVYKILEVYKLIDPTSDKRAYNSIKEKLMSMSDVKLKKVLLTHAIFFNIIIPPFTKFDIRSLKEASKLIDLQLDEYVTFPGGNKSKKRVPVGPSYFSAMEQLSQDYESVRSTSKYNRITGQPLKGKSESAQAVGELDLFALLGSGSDLVIKEFYGARSDNFGAKSKMISDLRKTGKTDILGANEVNLENSSNTSTDLFKVLMAGLGLNISGI